MRRVFDTIDKPWQTTNHPKFITTIMFLVYFVSVWFGTSRALDPTIDVIFSPTYPFNLWLNALLIIGGGLGMLAVATKMWFAERAAIYLIIGGLLGHLVDVYSYYGFYASDRQMWIGMAIISILFCLVRDYMIRCLDVAPKRGTK